MKTAVQLRAEVLLTRQAVTFMRDVARNEQMIRARMAEDSPGWFSLYSGGDPAGMVRHLQAHGYNAKVDGSTVWCRVIYEP